MKIPIKISEKSDLETHFYYQQEETKCDEENKESNVLFDDNWLIHSKVDEREVFRQNCFICSDSSFVVVVVLAVLDLNQTSPMSLVH